MKGEKRDEDAKTDEEEQIGTALGGGRNDSTRGQFLEVDQIESANGFGKGEVEIEQTDQKNKTPQTEINGNFPSGRLAFSTSPKADQEEGRNERELVKCIEEEKIHRSKRTRGTCTNQEEARVKERLAFFNFWGQPNRRKGDDPCEEKHEQAQPIDTDGVAQLPFWGDREGAFKLESAQGSIVGKKEPAGDEELSEGRHPRSQPGR